MTKRATNRRLITLFPSLKTILSCPNKCGSIPVGGNGNCGFGVMITDDAETSCFSRAANSIPEGRRMPEKPAVGTYRTSGCWSDSGTARALAQGSANADDMTVEKCISLANGAKYVGLEYSV
jgi:hypothetical protein